MKRYKFSFMISAFVIMACFTRSYSTNVYEVVTTHFLELDSFLDKITKEVSNIRSLNETDNLFIDKIASFPEFTYLMRTNSNGKIISKVSNGKAAARTYRFIGKQNWYKTMEISKKPYYGHTKSGDEYQLFWSRQSTKGNRFAGTITAKINLKISFNEIAEKCKSKFEVLYKNRTIYSNLGEDESGTFFEKKLAVYGMPGLTLKYKKPAPKPKPKPVIVDTQVQQQSSQVMQQAPQATQTQTAVKKQPKKSVTGPGSAKSGTAKAPADKKKVILIAVIIAAAILIVCIIIMQIAALKRKMLMRKIDRGDF